MGKDRDRENRQAFLLDKYLAVSYCNMTHDNGSGRCSY